MGQGSPRKGWKFCRRIPGWCAADREAGPMPFRVASWGTQLQVPRGNVGSGSPELDKGAYLSRGALETPSRKVGV